MQRRTGFLDLKVHDVQRLIAERIYCPLCRCRMSDDLGHPRKKHLDHIVPLVAGGTHTLGNVRVICAACNLSRPKDGSDVEQECLWARLDNTGELTATDVENEKQRREAVRVTRQAAKAAEHAVRIEAERRRRRAEQRGRQLAAATMRYGGLQWKDIVAAGLYASAGAAFNAVNRGW